MTMNKRDSLISQLNRPKAAPEAPQAPQPQEPSRKTQRVIKRFRRSTGMQVEVIRDTFELTLETVEKIKRIMRKNPDLSKGEVIELVISKHDENEIL